MASTAKWSKSAPFQSFLLMGLFLFFLAHLLLLSPSSLEEDFTGMRVIHPKDLLGFLRNESENLSAVPFLRSIAPTYSARDSTLYSTEGGAARFKLESRRTNLFQNEKIAHIQEARVTLQDGSRILSKEALYDLVKARITFMGSVQSQFKAGAVIRSELAYLDLKPGFHLEIPTTEAVKGEKTNLSSPLFFESMGLSYSDATGAIELLSKVHVTIRGERTLQIASDRGKYSQNQETLEFTMDDTKIIERQFVEVTEPGLLLKARRIEFKLKAGRQVEEILAIKDVFFEDLKQADSLTQGTGGRGIFRMRQNEIILSEFPQLYQDRDTVTGDSITYNRNTERVEVLQSNAIYNTIPRQNR